MMGVFVPSRALPDYAEGGEPMRWRSAAETHRGRQRSHNEDAVLARPEAGLWLVADGMGGHVAGDVAARMVTEALESVEAIPGLSALLDGVEAAMLDANDRMRAYAGERFEGRTIGCTVVILLIRDGRGVCLWAGDSRLYRLRDGALEQVTRDHSLLEPLVERGEMTPEEADAHPEGSVITRAVGAEPELVLDALTFDVRAGDCYLLCSDGLYRELGAEEIRERLAGERVEAVARALIDASLERGARDNVSVIVVRCQADESAAA